MKVFIEWVIAYRHRVVLLAVASAPVLPVVATALMALETARRGAAHGLLSASLATAVITAIAALSGANAAAAAVLGGMLFGVGVGAGWLLAPGRGSLALAFQGLVLLFALAATAMATVGPDPRELLSPLLEQVFEAFSAQGGSAEDLEAVRGWEAVVVSFLLGVMFAQMAAALLLAHWWLALTGAEVRFGVQFRSLRLGLVLGVPAMAMLALGLVSDALLVQNLTALALFAFFFQGLAVLHAWAHARRWHPLFVAPVYVLLVTPLTLLVLLGMSSIGLVDNIFDLRAPLRAGM